MQLLARASRVADMQGMSVVNLRGRSTLFPKDYFGVALGLHHVTVAANAPLNQAALALHNSLRAGLADVSTMEKPMVLAEIYAPQKSSKYLGRLSRARAIPEFKVSLAAGVPMLNSWVGYSWLDVTFGTGAKTQFMRVPPDFRVRRQIHIFPRAANEFQLRLQLPKAEMKRFMDELKCSVCKDFQSAKL